jgi:hypothetical protein
MFDMNSDIRIAVSFKGHRKRKKLTKLLGHKGVCCLIDLWLGAAMSNPNGTLSAWDCDDIANEAGWSGDSEKFVSALIECRFLDRNESGTYSLHDWADHQGYVVHADKRKEKARQAAETRWKNRNGVDAPSMPVACHTHDDGYAPSPAPAPSPVPPPLGKGKKDFDAIAFRPDFITEELWLALLANRKFKKLESSKLALTTMCNSLRAAVDQGYTIEDCVGAFCEGKWTRFNVEWMKNTSKTKAPSPENKCQTCAYEHQKVCHKSQELRATCTAYQAVPA